MVSIAFLFHCNEDPGADPRGRPRGPWPPPSDQGALDHVKNALNFGEKHVKVPQVEGKVLSIWGQFHMFKRKMFKWTTFEMDAVIILHWSILAFYNKLLISFSNRSESSYGALHRKHLSRAPVRNFIICTPDQPNTLIIAHPRAHRLTHTHVSKCHEPYQPKQEMTFGPVTRTNEITSWPIYSRKKNFATCSRENKRSHTFQWVHLSWVRVVVRAARSVHKTLRVPCA